MDSSDSSSAARASVIAAAKIENAPGSGRAGVTKL